MDVILFPYLIFVLFSIRSILDPSLLCPSLVTMA